MNLQKTAFLSCLFLLACKADSMPVNFTPQIVQIVDGQSLLIQLNEGKVTVIGAEDEGVRIVGQMIFPDKTEYEVVSTPDQIQIVAYYAGSRSSDVPIHLEVHVPDNVKLKVETEFASVAVRDYEGELEATSVSGDILIEDVNGVITARSDRGDVKVLNSTGKISVVGNYGFLTVEGVQGDTGVSTIMGTITFNGLIRTGDAVRLEADHGPVSVNLSQNAALSLRVRSNSGNVACMLPGITSSLRTCDGAFNSGGGTLTIRTVSGGVTLQLIP